MQRSTALLIASLAATSLVSTTSQADTQEVDIDLDAEEEDRGSLDDSAGKEEEGPTMAYEDQEAHLAEDEAKAKEEDSGPGFFERQKVRFGLRFGYAFPMGGIGTLTGGQSLSLSSSYNGLIPIWFEAGYRISKRITVGLVFVYSFPSLVCGTEGGLDYECSGSNVRLGLQGQYELSPLDLGPVKKTIPWFGLGVGYEWASAEFIGGGLVTNYSLSGLEFVNLQGGVNVPLFAALTAGPFLSFSLGQYSSRTRELSTPDGRNFDDSSPLHMWLTLGIKGEYTL